VGRARGVSAGRPRGRRLAGFRLAGFRLAAAGLAAAGLGLALPVPACAHGGVALGDFYAGLLQPLFHPESLLGVLALGLLAGQRPERALWRVLLTFVVATSAGTIVAQWLPEAAAFGWTARATTLVMGVLVAASWAPPDPMLLGLTALAGVAHGQVATAPEVGTLARPILWVVGLPIGVLLITAHVVALMLKLRAFWAQIAFRVAGSWIATIVLLVSALALAKTPP